MICENKQFIETTKGMYEVIKKEVFYNFIDKNQGSIIETQINIFEQKGVLKFIF